MNLSVIIRALLLLSFMTPAAGLISLGPTSLGLTSFCLACFAEGTPPEQPVRAIDPASEGAGDGESWSLEFLLDPWPARPRMFGYEYNQKNHTDLPAPLDLEASSSSPRASGKRYRLIGLRFQSKGSEPEELLFHSRQIEAGKEFKVVVPAGESVTRFFVFKEPKDRLVHVEVKKKGAKKPALREIELSADGRASRRPEEAFWVALELEREDQKRREVKARRVTVTLKDDLNLLVPNAHLMLLINDGMMVYEGDTGADGAWSGPVMPGSYEIFAFAEVPDRTDRSAATAVIQLPRLLLARGVLAANATEILIQPDRVVDVQTSQADGGSLVPARLWLTPEPLVPAYRYALIAQTLKNRARLESSRENPLGHFLLLTTQGLGTHFAGVASIDAATTLFMRGVISGDAKEFHFAVKPEEYARVSIDPAAGFGGGKSAKVALTALSSVRESAEIETSELHTFILPEDGYRTEIVYALNSGGEVPLLPYRLSVTRGGTYDLTPRGPLDLPLYWKRDGKKVQFWLAVIDAGGRVLWRLPEGGNLSGAFRGEMFIERGLEQLAFEYAQGFESVDLEKIEYVAEFNFGNERVLQHPHLERTTVYNVDGQSANAPACFGDRINELLPEVKKSIDGCYETFGLPDMIRRLHLEFMVFMPPGVGGTGGGGQITFEIGALYPFTGGTDLLPWAYRHELGHNLGFGHDPYMLIMPAGVDEARFSSYGYRMLNAVYFARTLLYLEGDRRAEKDPWYPSEGVYAGMRFLYGPDVHKKMLTERRASEQTLLLHNLSSIERIATLYSLVVNENVAWVFRAHGWPVFDERVEIGLNAVRVAKQHPLQLNYSRLEGTPIAGWWVLGPESAASEEPGWRKVSWPSNFIRLDEDRPPSDLLQKYRLFRRIILPEDEEVRLVYSSDVQLQVMLNGTVVNFVDASPQFSQPVHDEMMLNQKRGLAVHLFAGENIVEAVALQPPGSRGFLLEFLDEKGDAVRLAFDDDGPDGAPAQKKAQALGFRNPIYNGSFELGEKIPTAWLLGPVEPEGGIGVMLDTFEKTNGDRSVRLELNTQARGGIIQRIVLDPGKKYRLRATIRTRDLVGETFVSFFSGDAHEQSGKTEPLREPNQDWKVYEATWYAGIQRVIYVSCYVKGKSGRVWFDNLEMVEER